MQDITSRPFYASTYNGVHCYYLTVDDRLRMVKNFDAAKCRAALQLKFLQKTVRTAVERRLRKLERAS